MKEYLGSDHHFEDRAFVKSGQVFVATTTSIMIVIDEITTQVMINLNLQCGNRIQDIL